MIHLYKYPVEIGEKVTSQPLRHDVPNARFMKNSTTRPHELDVHTFPAIYYLSLGIQVSTNSLNNVNFQISSSTECERLRQSVRYVGLLPPDAV